MRDLLLQCTCVCTYTCTYMSVTLMNVNLWYHLGCQFEVTLGMSICTHAWTGYRIRALHEDVGATFLGYGGQGGQGEVKRPASFLVTVWPSSGLQCAFYIAKCFVLLLYYKAIQIKHLQQC